MTAHFGTSTDSTLQDVSKRSQLSTAAKAYKIPRGKLNDALMHHIDFGEISNFDKEIL